ncbi:glycosyl transferase [Martelella alba]|uniref:Glycosyl transferase n=1 Tax=Martelella alba TaxID=2590451 RepID=A0A506U379_9HYPH|nr:glycosyl hydrolase family 65 protein [Martelella alba]TPW27474.1 glycosyl transferase [Martelella alba]
MKYGYFDDTAREYVITRPDTPYPWVNYIGCEGYFGILSATGGGYSYYRDARLRRLTRGRYNNVPLDMSGRYVYVRDNETADFWSPSWMPTQSEVEDYSCRHGMGYSTIGSKRNGIRVSNRYFVPLGETLEIWQLTVTNERLVPADVSLFSSVEFCLWDALDDMTNFQRNLSTGQVEVEDEVIYHKTEYRERRNHFAYFACSEKLAGFDTSREDFLGPWRGWDKPVAVAEGRSRDSIAHGWSPMGSHHVKMVLQPGETRQVIFVLGYHENDKAEKFDPPGSQRLNKKTVAPVIEKYRQIENVETAFSALKTHWDDLLGVYQVSSPDIHADRMVNIWNAYQCMATFNMSRSASSFESGIGRGLGFRDSNQDLLGFVHMVPARARERILDIAATQLSSGGAYHQYQPLTKKGNNDIGGDFNDDPHWLIIGVAAYLKETGDFSILEEPVVFDNQPGTEEPLYAHLTRAMQYALDRIGPHGLPLIGRADWNDCLNLNCFSDTPGESFQTTTSKDGKVAESVFIAGLMVLSARELSDIARETGKADDADRYARVAADMDGTIRTHGWDGEWFVRAYDDFGRKIGSKENEEGKIFIESQGFCVLAGVGVDDGKARKALDSVAKHLATPHGIVVLQPAYTKYYIEYGEISTYPPGYKENAGIFCHNNPWVMIAETVLGNGDAAFDYYNRINPSAREAISDTHRLEPYVYAQMIAGRDATRHGEAKNSWLTGTAAWNYYAITQFIFGIRPEYEGLRVAPVIPERWSGFSVSRTWRGVTYDITVTRKGPGNAVSLVVDGQPVAGDLVSPPADGVTAVKVEGFIG